MKIQFDKDANALYISFVDAEEKKSKVIRTERLSGAPMVIDFDEKDKILGLEIFDMTACASSDFKDSFLLQHSMKTADTRRQEALEKVG